MVEHTFHSCGNYHNSKRGLTVCLFVCFVPRLDIEECKSCQCDFVQVHNDFNLLQDGLKICRRNSFQYLEHRRLEVGSPVGYYVDGRTLYLRFVSDEAVHLKGFKVSIVPGSYNGKL